MKYLKIAWWLFRLATDAYEKEIFTSMDGDFESYFKMKGAI